MWDTMEPFDAIKFAAFSNAKNINHLVKNVTIGPNRTLIEDEVHNSNIIDISTKPIKPSSKISLRRPTNTNNTNLVINQLRSELEKQRQDKVKEAVNKRINSFKEFSERQELEMKQQAIKQQLLLMNKVTQQELMIVKTLEQHDKDRLAQHQQLVQYYKELSERKKKINLELQEKERRKQQINLIIDKLKADQIEFRHIYQDICNTLKACRYMNQLKTAMGDVIRQLRVMPESMDEIVTQCKNGIISENDHLETSKLVQNVKELLEVVKQKVLEVETAEERLSQAPTATESVSNSSLSLNAPSSSTVIPSSTIQPSDIHKFISKSSLKIYTELQSYLDAFESSLAEFVNNDSLKQFRFECKKAVNIPLNAISATSREHLTDKYNRLSNLLNGKIVEVGGAHIRASNTPQGVAYCMNIIASNLVLQGDLMISSKPEAAFSYAAVAVALWNEQPDFGKLLLAHFHSQCPYLVPIYPPRSVGQTDEEYYRTQGYRYIEGVVEKQDKFLKRMSGTVALYATIIITHPKRGHTKNPHGLNEGWRWLSAFINLEPKPDITATMLQAFLEIAGSTLEQAYGKSFQKLVAFISHVYLPMIQRIDSGGPVTRLEVLLQNYMSNRRFKTPTGMLHSNFW